MVGQHIRILKGGRWVHAVDCGDETVLHLAEEAPPPRVRRAYRPEFVAGADVVEVVTHRERTFPPKEIVKRAYSRASDPALASMFGDSESFVEWCTTGRLSAAHNFAVAVPGFAPAPAAPAAPAARAEVEPRRAPKAKAGPGAKVKAAARAKPAPAQKRKGATAAKVTKVAARRAAATRPAAKKKAKAPAKAAPRARTKAPAKATARPGAKAARPAKAGGKPKRAGRGRR